MFSIRCVVSGYHYGDSGSRELPAIKVRATFTIHTLRLTVGFRVLAHPRVLEWQETWAENTLIDDRILHRARSVDTDEGDDVMNYDETKPRSLWDLSEWAESLSEIV